MSGGLHLFQRKGIWQCRLPIRKQGNRRYIWRSLKTTSYHEAKQKAEDWQVDVRHHEKYKISLFPKKVDDVIDQWLAETDLTMSMHSACTKALRYWRVYIGEKYITEIGDTSGYIKWRRDYWKRNDAGSNKTRKKEPADRTIALEVQTMRRVFTFAFSKNYTPQKIEVAQLKRIRKNPRPALPLTEQFQLKSYLLKGGFIPRANCKNDYLDAHRAMLRALILTLLLTGIRVGEARNLRWNHVEEIDIGNGKKTLLLRVSGKTSGYEAISRPSLHRHLFRYKRWLQISGFFKGENSRVFLDRYGNPIGDLREGFQKICKGASIPRYPLYSLRHSFITNYLRYAKHPDLYALAKSCGTSIEMIEKFYGHVPTREHVRRLVS